MANLQPWQHLMANIEVLYPENLNPATEEELLAFEVESEIILPDSFKAFCQVFGSGAFCEMIGIDCPPSTYFSQERIGHLQQALRSLREADPRRFNSDFAENLLDRALVFGSNSRQESFFWDLQTYSSNDLSYDIYSVRINSPNTYLVGREFTEFITEFCLGDKAFRILPDDAQPPCEDIYRTFIA